MLALSAKGIGLKNLMIVCDSDWASWLHVLPLFTSGSKLFREVTVIVPSFNCVNYFGLCRDKRVKWKKMNLLTALSLNLQRSLHTLVSSCDLILYSGNIVGLNTLILCAKDNSTSHIVAIVPGSERLRKLQRFSTIQWKHTKHASVGGASSASVWIGSNREFRDPSVPLPTFCPSSMCDLLEFAPKSIPVSLHPAPSDSVPSHRINSLLPHPDQSNTWLCQGLFPTHKFVSSHMPFYVITPTPFTTTKWCKRQVTAVECARFFDLPVPCERRIKAANPGLLPSGHPLRQATPVKLLNFALWLTGYCNDVGGVHLLKPKFREDSTGLIVSQDDFNLIEDEVDVKAVKMDDAAVPVHIWDSRLVNTYPVPNQLKGLCPQKISWSLDVFRKHLVWVWHKCIFKSFSRYMHLTWKDQWYCKAFISNRS